MADELSDLIWFRALAKSLLTILHLDMCSRYLYFIHCGVSAVPTKRSSHYVKGVLIGAMSTLCLALVVLLALLWAWMLSKKERAAKRYTEVKKQVQQDASEWMLYPI